MEGGIWPTQNFWRSTPYARARPLPGFIRRAGVKGRDGSGTEREKGQKGKKWKESWNRAADWLRPALTVFGKSTCSAVVYTGCSIAFQLQRLKSVQ